MDRTAPRDPILLSFLSALGLPSLSRDAVSGLDAWARATDALLAELPSSHTPRPALGHLADAWCWARLAEHLEADALDAPTRWPALTHEAGLAVVLSREALQRLADAHPTPLAFARAAARRSRLLAALLEASPGGLATSLVSQTDAAVCALDALRDPIPGPLAERIATTLPWLAGLSATADSDAAVEHATDVARGSSPVLLHLQRVLERKLTGLEGGDLAVFQDPPGISEAAFDAERARLHRLEAAGLLPVLRAALLHLDFAKAGTPTQRTRWTRELGVDLGVHNEAAALLLERDTAPGATQPGLLSVFAPLAAEPLQRLVRTLVRSHGLTGQALRGETPLALFAPFVAELRHGLRPLCAHLGVDDEACIELVLDALHLINLCDTAGVREGLVDDALHEGMRQVLAHVRQVVRSPASGAAAVQPEGIEAELAAWEDTHWRALGARVVVAASDPAGAPLGDSALRVIDRLARLRGGRLLAGEPLAHCEAAVRAESAAAVERLLGLLRMGQLWYAEAATSALSAAAQLKVLAIALAAAARLPEVDTRRPFHVSLQPLLRSLHRGVGGASVPYRVRLIEALVEPLTLEAILDAPRGTLLADSALGTFATDIGGTTAVALRFTESVEASALLTLLPIYETRSSAAFHATLKTLCDLYGLRKDEFDRVANEALYLVHMNSARSDKARMLDHVRPGRIVEVGPGGGVILDMLEERFPDAEVIGLDVSRMVVEALHARRQRDGRRWTILEADAFELAERMGEGTLSTVIFCSLLHEIYSYCEYVDPVTGERGRFRLESVRNLLQASYRALEPGGRLVIRDGVMPPPGVRILELVADDAREFFDLFVAQFEGRRISFEEVAGSAGKRVRLSTADAMEFLYTYTWGAESFPYEVREQYGVLPYEAYRDAVLGWLSEVDAAHPPRWIELPAEERSYLQPGYEAGLAGKVALYDADGRATRLPDSNCLLVFEKVAQR